VTTSEPPIAEVVLTHATEPRGYRLCRCSVCDEVHRCTPSSDFFTVGGEADEPLENGKPLFCASCFFDWCARHMDRSRSRAPS